VTRVGGQSVIVVAEVEPALLPSPVGRCEQGGDV
jgi:hypothetical protein